MFVGHVVIRLLPSVSGPPWEVLPPWGIAPIRASTVKAHLVIPFLQVEQE